MATADGTRHEEKIIIDVEATNADHSIAQMAELRRVQDALKEEVKKHKKELKDLHDQEEKGVKLTAEQLKKEQELYEKIEKTSVEVRNYNRYLNDHQKVVEKSIDETHRQAGSLRQMRMSVGELTAEWENLSKEQREGARGEEVQKELANLNSEINKASLSVNNFKDNVGNYASALDGMIGRNTVAGRAFGAMGISAADTGAVMKTKMVEGINSVNAALKILLVNPIFAVLAGITVIIMTIHKGIQKNQAAMDAFQRVLAPVGKLLDIIFDYLGKIVEKVMKTIEWFGKLFGLSESTAYQAVKLQQEIEKEENKLIVRRAKRNVQIADLEEELLKKEQYTHEERLEMAQEVQRLNAEAIEDEKAIIQEKMRIWEMEQEGTDTSREEWAKYYEMEAKVIEMDKQLADNNRRTTRTIDQMNRALRQEKEAEEEALKAKRKAYAERLKLQKEFEKQTAEEIEDILLENIKDLRKKEIKAEEIAHQRQIEAIKKRLETEKNLTRESRKNLNFQIELLKDQHLDKLDKIAERHRKEDEAIEADKEALRLEKQAETDAKIEAQRLARKKLKIEQRRDELNDDLIFNLELKRIEHDELLRLDAKLKAELFANDEEYQIAVIEARRGMVDAENAYQQAIEETAQMQILAVASIAGAMSQMLTTVAGDSEALTTFAKALALVDIATNTGVAISGAIKAGAAAGPFPYNLAAISTGVGAVMSGITSAYSVLKSSTPALPSNLAGGGAGADLMGRSTSKISIDNSALIRELGSIEARGEIERNNIHSQEQFISVVDINHAQSAIKLKEKFANT